MNEGVNEMDQRPEWEKSHKFCNSPRWVGFARLLIFLS